MPRLKGEKNALTETLLACTLIFFLILSWKTAYSRILSNAGLAITIDSSSKSASGEAVAHVENLFHKALIADNQALGAYRGRGFIHWYRREDLQAFDMWQHLNMTAYDYLLFGQHASDIQEALRWYTLSERLDPHSKELWLHVGKICQKYAITDDICKDFLIYNKFNQFIDPEFSFGQIAWRYNRREGADYAMISCPDSPVSRCASARIKTLTSPHGTSWYQCLILETGQKYHFGAWIKVDTVGQWRPLYYQGNVNESPHGHSLGGLQKGKQDWIYWEQEFVAPDFDDDRACFHPIRLLDIGRVWFHHPSLKILED